MPEHTPHGPEDTNSNPVSEQVRHSGHHGEQPAYEFRNPDGSHMTIQEAMDAGLIHPVPNTIGEHRDPTNSQPTEAYVPLYRPETPSEAPLVTGRRKKLAAIAAGVVGTAVIGGLGVGVAKSLGGEDKDRSSDVTTSQSSDDLGELLGVTPSAETPEATPSEPEQSTPPPEVISIEPSLLPIELGEGEYYPLPTQGTPEELAAQFCRGVSSAITSNRMDAARNLYANDDSPAFTMDQLAFSNYQSALDDLAQTNPELGTPAFAMTCNVTHVEKTGMFGDLDELLQIDIESEAHIIDENGNSLGVIAGPEVMNRTITIDPDETVTLPNGETMTGYVVAQSSTDQVPANGH